MNIEVFLQLTRCLPFSIMFEIEIWSWHLDIWYCTIQLYCTYILCYIFGWDPVLFMLCGIFPYLAACTWFTGNSLFAVFVYETSHFFLFNREFVSCSFYIHSFSCMNYILERENWKGERYYKQFYRLIFNSSPL